MIRVNNLLSAVLFGVSFALVACGRPESEGNAPGQKPTENEVEIPVPAFNGNNRGSGDSDVKNPLYAPEFEDMSQREFLRPLRQMHPLFIPQYGNPLDLSA